MQDHGTGPDIQSSGRIADRIVEHMIGRLKSISVERSPFQHLYVENVFPADVYAQILAKLPLSSSYLPFNKKRWRNDQGESTRDRLCLSEGELDRIDDTRRGFWADIKEALESDKLRQAIYQKLSTDIAIRLSCSPDAVVQQPAYPNVMLVRDYKDYRIKPHPDGQPRVVTMQFYLPEGGAREELGTSLYIKRPAAYRLFGRPFKEIKRFPFRPNSAYAIAVNDCAQRQSYHGRELITETATVRDSIIIAWLSRNVSLGQKHAA